MLVAFYVLSVLAITLPIPTAVLIGSRWHSGAMVASALSAALAFLPVWIGYIINIPPSSPFLPLFSYGAIFLLSGGVLLFISAWAIALQRALSQRHWWGFLLALIGGLLSDGLFFFENPFFYHACPSGYGGVNCLSDPQLTRALFLVVILAGPGAILAYAWRWPQARLTVSPTVPENAPTGPLNMPRDVQ